jgi:E3 ubiquitin-protein ligase MUL1
MRLRRPRQDAGGAYGHRVFTVTQQPFDEYVDTFGTVGRVFGVACVSLTAAGATMVLVKAARARLTRWRERRFVRRLAAAEKARREAAAAAAAGSGTPGASAAGASEAIAADDDVPPSRRPGETCVVCLHDEARVCYRECGHLVCCETCAAKLTRCPLCRRRSSWMRVYRAGG